MLVEVRPLDLKKFHGKKGKENFSQPKTVEVLYNDQKGGYETGLTEEETAEYSKRTGMDLSTTFIQDEPHPFWSTKAAWIKLPNSTVIFNTERPLDFVKVKNLKVSKYVANSVKEYEEGKWPEATHVIYDENEEVANQASKVQLRSKATVLASQLSADGKIAIIQILSNKSYKGRSNDFIDVEVSKIIEDNAGEFIKYVNMGKEEVTIRANVLEMLSKNILSKDGGAVFYMGEMIGIDYESAVQWFRDPNNTKLKVAILERLNAGK